MKIGKVVYIFILFLGIIGMLDTIVLFILGIGDNFGALFPGIAGVLISAAGIKKLYSGPGTPLIPNRKLRRVVAFIGLIYLLSFIAMEGLIIYGSVSNEDSKADYLLILGSGLKGEKLSQTLSKRMETGLEYIKTHPGVKVVVSGGQGSGESIPEAEAMRRFLVENKVDERQILKEDKSTSTMENYRFSKEIILKDGGNADSRIIVVTSGFHMFRAKMLAKRNGLKVYGISSRTPAVVLVNYYFREYAALIKSYLLDR